jgi:hypothetical protein
VLLDAAREGQPVDARHHQIDDQQVGPRALQAAQRLGAVAGGRDLESVVAKLLRNEHQQVRIVVHDEDPLRSLSHRGASLAAPDGASIAPPQSVPRHTAPARRRCPDAAIATATMTDEVADDV